MRQCFTLRSDQVLGIFIIIFSVVLVIMGACIDINPNQQTLSARFFPLLLAAILFLLGLILILKAEATPFTQSISAILNLRSFSVSVLLLSYYLSFRHIDFRVGSWFFMLASMWVLGSRNTLELLIVPLLTSLLVFLLFRYGFNVLLPVWI